MKILYHTILLVLFNISLVNLHAQVNFIEIRKEKDMEEAYRVATEDSLNLFVDVYADWCAPCKMMDREVYADPEVGSYLNANFVNVRLDGESPFGRMFSAENQLEGYPSMFLFDTAGNHISTFVGYMGSRELVEKLGTTIRYHNILGVMDLQYQEGSLAREDYPVYLTSLRAMGREEEAEMAAMFYAVNYKLKKKLADNDIKVIAYYLGMDDELWKPVSEDLGRMKDVLAEDYLLVIEKAYNRTLMKGIEEENLEIIELLSNSIDGFIADMDVQTGSMTSLPYIQYFYYTGQNSELINFVDSTYNHFHKGDHSWLFEIASRVIEMDQNYLTHEILDKGVEWFSECIRLKETYDYFYYKGMCLYFLQRGEEAREAFNMADSLAEDENQHQTIKQVLEFVNSSPEK